MSDIWSRFGSFDGRDAVRRASRRVRRSVGAAVPRALRRRYAWKFAAAMLLAILVAGTVGAASYAQVTDSLDAQVEQQATSTAELQADGMSEWIASKAAQTRTISSAWQFQLGSSQAVSSYLFQRGSSLGEGITAIHYVDVESGVVRESTATSLEGDTAADLGLPWADVDRNLDSAPSSVYVSNATYDSPVTGERSFVLASRPPEREGVVVLVTVGLGSRVDGIEQTMAGGRTAIYESDGSVAASTARNATAAPAEGVTANGTTFLRGEDAVVAYAPVDGVDWVLATRVPNDSAYALGNGVQRSLVWTILAAVGAFGAVSVVVGHRTTRTLKRLTDGAEEIADGDLAASLETDREDEFGRLYDAVDEMRTSLRASLDEAEALNDRLESTAADYRAVMDRAADGDLTRRMAPDGESEAMADIARSYNRTMDELAAVVGDAQAFGESVAAASETTSARVTAVSEASESVNQSMADILEEAVEQDAHLDDVSERTDEFSATIQQMSAAATEVADRADAAAERGESGREAAAAATEELDAIESATEHTVEQVEALESVVDDIESVVDFIDDVASQTHVLALNASIEAARAGEAGEGFAVVAEEVKQLAEETQTATDRIEDSLDRVRERTTATAADIRRTRRRVDEGGDTIERATAALDSLVDDIEETAEGIQEIRRATERQAETTTGVAAAVADVSAISERTSSGARDAAAATEEQAESLAAVSERVDRLADRAVGLQDALDRFDAETTGDSTASDAERSPPVGDGDRDGDAPPNAGDEVEVGTGSSL